MTRLVLHIGSYRTGSTSVQQCLVRSRRFLRTRGILYPTTGLYREAHHGLGWWVTGNHVWSPRGSQPCEDIVEMLTAEIRAARCETVIISTEVLADVVDQSAGEGVRHRLSRLLASCEDVTVLCCVRHQAPLIESLYRFKVAWEMTGMVESFAECVAAWSIMPHMNHANTVRFLREIRPEARFRWWSFAEAVAVREVVRRFYVAAGIEDSYRGERRVNESRSREATLAMREWNRAGIGGWLGRRAFAAWAQAAFPENGMSLYDSGLLTTVVGRFREANGLLEAQTGIRLLDTPEPAAMTGRLAGETLDAAALSRVQAQLRGYGRWPWSWCRSG